MAWERGYYYRVRREGKRVIREYIGRGKLANLIAEIDARERREKRKTKRRDAAALKEEKAALGAVDADLDRFIDVTKLLAHAALVVAGFHQHKRGEWRKRRGCCTEA